MATKKEKQTLFYKLFSMSKKEWDMEVNRHQQKLNKRQRDYMLTFKQHEAMSPAQRRAKKQENIKKKMEKEGGGGGAGIHPSRVNQRRTQMTVKK